MVIFESDTNSQYNLADYIWYKTNQTNFMKWEAKLLKHKGDDRIAIYFEKDAAAIKRIKLLKDIRWSVTLKAWHLPDTAGNRIQFKLPLAIEKKEDHVLKLAKFKLWLKSKRYSENTIKTYCEALNSFLKFHHDKLVSEINNEDVILYTNQFILKHQLSSSYQNQIVTLP